MNFFRVDIPLHIFFHLRMLNSEFRVSDNLLIIDDDLYLRTYDHLTFTKRVLSKNRSQMTTNKRNPCSNLMLTTICTTKNINSKRSLSYLDRLLFVRDCLKYLTTLIVILAHAQIKVI